MCILGGGDYSQKNTLVDRNILRGERNLWDIGNRRYLAMEKVTLSGSLQTQRSLDEELDGRDDYGLILKLETLDFPWKFLRTVQKYKTEKVQYYKNSKMPKM